MVSQVLKDRTTVPSNQARNQLHADSNPVRILNIEPERTYEIDTLLFYLDHITCHFHLPIVKCLPSSLSIRYQTQEYIRGPSLPRES